MKIQIWRRKNKEKEKYNLYIRYRLSQIKAKVESLKLWEWVSPKNISQKEHNLNVKRAYEEILRRKKDDFENKFNLVHKKLDEAQEMGVILSMIYIVLIIPVLIYYKYLESNHMAFSEWIHEILAGQTCNSLFGPFCAMFSIDYYRNIRQTFCSNNENGMTNGSNTVNREAITSREDNNSEFYWDARLGNSREARTEKYSKKRDAALKYIVTPEGYRVVLPTGEKHSRYYVIYFQVLGVSNFL